MEKFFIICIGVSTELFGPFDSKFDAENWLSMIHCQIEDINEEEGRCENNILTNDHFIMSPLEPLG